MEPWAVSSIITLITTLLASTGFWTYIQRKDTVKNSTEKLILGLTYDRIIHLGMKYVDRGFVTKDEYEDLLKFFYTPYKDLGGNGMAERVVLEVSRLPIKSNKRALDDLRQNGLPE